MTSGFLQTANIVNSWIVPLLFLLIVAFGYAKKVKVYETFVDGAKEGFTTAVMIIPYLVVILAAIAMLRSSGAMTYIAHGISFFISEKIMPPDIVLLALIKPLSGGAARGVMLDIFQTYGVDSKLGYMASVIQGSTETTFYVIAVYFGAVNIKRTRHTIPAGLCGEFTGIIMSVIIANIVYR